MNEERTVQIEKLAIERLEEERKRLGLSQKDLGERAYPQAVNPYMRVQALRINRGNGKPQRLRLGDFVALCEALGLDPGKVLWEVRDIRLENQEHAESSQPNA